MEQKSPAYLCFANTNFLKTKFFLALVLVLAGKGVSAQKYDRFWAFGDSAGIDFSDTLSPISIYTSCSDIVENNASMSNRNAIPIFCIGRSSGPGYPRLYDQSGSQMLNGDSLFMDPSSTNGCIILPDYGDTSHYTLFYINPFLYSAKVDLSLNGGLGGVSQKNIPLDTTDFLAEKLTAIKHANGRDWWLISHLRDENVFVRFCVTPTAIFGPYYDTTGAFFSAALFYRIGEITPSFDGGKLALCNYTNSVELYSFDRCNGKILLLKDLTAYLSGSTNRYYGNSFCRSGKYIYCSTLNSPPTSDLYQINISDMDNISSQLTYSISTTVGQCCFAQHQIGPNGKIYLSNNFNYSTAIQDSCTLNLSVIESPDSAYPVCNFQPHSFYLGGRVEFAGLPNYPNYRLGALPGSPCDTLGLGSPQIENSVHGLSIFPNPNSGSFTLNYFLPHGSSGNLEIYNLLGQLVYQTELKKNSTETNFSLPLGRAGEGLLLCRVISCGQVASVRFIIER